MHTSKAAVAAALVAVAVAACGGSSKKSNSSAQSTPAATTSASSPTATSPTSTSTSATSSTGSHPLSKAAYEARLGPLLNQRVAPALRAALANGGGADPAKLRTAVHLIDEARNAMASLTPPAAIADLNHQAVVTLSALGADMSKLASDLQAHNTSASTAAAHKVEADALKIEALGNQFSARGF
jgi:hypothetical protein